MRESFFFGIPLIARAVAGDWQVVDHLLGMTLRSVLAQGDGDVCVLLAAHDVPESWLAVAGDPRFTLLRADWPPEPPTPANDDGGRKKWLVKRRVREEGGVLMFLDADDRVATDVVARARAAIGPDDVGALVGAGHAVDYASGRTLPFPIGGGFGQAFHELCGSSTVARVVPGAPDLLRSDPHAALGSHHEWAGAAARRGVALARLDTVGAYLIGTGANHSERESPVAAWRRRITDEVCRRGEPLTASLAGRFGLHATMLGDDIR